VSVPDHDLLALRWEPVLAAPERSGRLHTPPATQNRLADAFNVFVLYRLTEFYGKFAYTTCAGRTLQPSRIYKELPSSAHPEGEHPILSDLRPAETPDVALFYSSLFP